VLASTENNKYSKSKSTVTKSGAYSKDMTFSNNAEWYSSIIVSEKLTNECGDDSILYNNTNNTSNTLNNGNSDSTLPATGSTINHINFAKESRDRKKHANWYLDDGYFSYCFSENDYYGDQYEECMYENDCDFYYNGYLTDDGLAF
jgi:hypothetical protein